MMGAGGTRTQERRSEPPCPQGGLELGQNEGRGSTGWGQPGSDGMCGTGFQPVRSQVTNLCHTALEFHRRVLDP